AWGRTLVVAHGRDPYFPGWIDTAQLDAFSPSYRQAALETLLDIADQCDGVRCDMAMLLVNRIFAQTWGDYVDEPPKTEFWEDIIPNVKALHPNFIFIAEVYWDMEHELQKLGFDYTYDKVFYDRLVEQELEQLKTHLQADINYQNHTI
ncbi:MAG: alpha-amylase, partial [Phototrophicales bacterium]